MKVRVKDVLITFVVGVLGMLIVGAMFVGAVIQQSFRNCPPTPAELTEEPALEVYLNE